jgi:NADPH:quinone reductase
MKGIVRQLAEQRITPVIGQAFPLAEAAKAHEAMEARRTVAKTVLLAE